ncbi:chromosome partition protein Smc [Spirochaetia bacterium]|nr:chromosome partition protein Smc [Spirochaetia bacterium]
MFLKSLDIFGFKSFADKTHIEFADGITALMGPNGCGKSNVVDAIKWVLGEKSPKTLRADKMEDVIFNGTETRKAVSVAEVTLTLANEKGLLPIDMPEVQIKRRLYRDGNNEYFINSQEKLLKDIRELFWDTGVGKTAYSVMEQGKIDQALSSKPEERRYLFEEAAGITSFKVKTREAEIKITKTEENIRQSEGLLKEIKKNYDVLKVQAEKTARYRILKDEVFNYERDIQLLKLKQFRDNRDAHTENIKNKTEEREKIRTELEKISKALEDNMDEVNSLQNQYNETQKNLFGLAKEKNGLENEIALISEQHRDCKKQIDQYESRERSINSKIEELREECDDQDEVVRDLRKRVAGLEENIHSFEENIKLASSRIGDNENAVRSNEDEIKNLEHKRSGFEVELQKITDDIVSALDAGLKNAGYTAAGRQKTQVELEESLKRLNTLIRGRETLLRDLAKAEERAVSGGTSLSPEEVKRITESIAGGLTDAAVECDNALALFADYVKSTPTFIDEFLAPEGIITKKRALDNEIREIKESIQARFGKISELRHDNEALGVKIDEYRQTLHNLQVNRAQMIANAQAADDKAKLLRRELTGQEAQLKGVQDELFLAHKRLDGITERISETQEKIAEIEKHGVRLSADMEKLEKDIAKRSGEVSGKQDDIKKKTETLEKVNRQLEQIHLFLTQSETEIKNTQENFRETHSRDLMEFEERIYTITAGAQELREKLNVSKNSIRELGQVNFMATEEFKETKDRYDFQNGQLEDLLKAKSDLEAIAAESRAQACDRFMTSYNKIKKNFHNMFRRLFGGGQAQLRLLDPNHVLESGIEIFAQPPGKKLENIMLLSGGEKSMTAVALLFATYMVKPSPFCFLDEIDAALDEANIGRFVQLLREFGHRSQFIVITHNKKTIISAATLLGLTMQEKGITQTVAIRVQNGDAVIEEEPDGGENANFFDFDFKEEEVAVEDGRELPPGVDDPALVTEAQLHPLRSPKQ